MGDFNTAYKLTAIVEGGYANNATDRGGETYKGISRRNWPGWAGWVIIDEAKINPKFPACLRDISALENLVQLFYKNNFWNTLRLDEIENQAVCNEMFDTGVNCSTSFATTTMQRSLNVLNNAGKIYSNVLRDGKMGPETVSCINSHKNIPLLLKAYNCLQGAHYIAIAENDESQEIFMRSWLSRVSI